MNKHWNKRALTPARIEKVLKMRDNKRSSVSWYLREDVPNRNYLEIKNQVKALLDNNLFLPGEIEKRVKILKKPEGRSKRLHRRRSTHEKIFENKTKKYQQLFTESNVNLRVECRAKANHPRMASAVENFKKFGRLKYLYHAAKKRKSIWRSNGGEEHIRRAQGIAKTSLSFYK